MRLTRICMCGVLQDVKGVPRVERTFTVTPSHQPSCITLSYNKADGSGRQTVKEGQEIEAPAGEYLSSLSELLPKTQAACFH